MIKRRSNGFSLLEVVVVVSLVSLISLSAYENIVRFQKNALLDQAADEFASRIEHQKEKSISGAIEKGKRYSDYDEDHLPRWGIGTDPTDNEYHSLVVYQTSGTEFKTTIETFALHDNLRILPDSERYFDRITGDTGPVNFTISDVKTGNTKSVSITTSGNVVVKEI